MKRLFALVAVVGLVAIAGLVGASLPLSQGDDAASAAATPLVTVSTATVAQRTMRSTEEFDGTLGYAGEGVVIAGLNGTYTKLPAAGDILTLGDEIYEVDGKNSSYLMYGERPAWRRLTNDSDKFIGLIAGHESLNAATTTLSASLEMKKTKPVLSASAGRVISLPAPPGSNIKSEGLNSVRVLFAANVSV